MNFQFNKFFFLFILLISTNTQTSAQTIDSIKAQTIAVVSPPIPIPIPNGLLRLKAAYPDFIERVDLNTVYFKDGKSMLYNDGEVDKSLDTMLYRPDIEDMMKFSYPVGLWYGTPLESDEAGRYRYEPFFQKMYGATKAAVERNLTTIIWLPGIADTKLRVSKVNGIAEKLQLISNELATLPTEFQKYLKHEGGTFNWRTVSGSTRRSLHSFGIALDINPQYADYWDWTKDKNGNFTYHNQVPMEIVLIFEKYGFIWGGKWLHHDTMHFEYRPELIGL